MGSQAFPLSVGRDDGAKQSPIIPVDPFQGPRRAQQQPIELAIHPEGGDVMEGSYRGHKTVLSIRNAEAAYSGGSFQGASGVRAICMAAGCNALQFAKVTTANRFGFHTDECRGDGTRQPGGREVAGSEWAANEAKCTEAEDGLTTKITKVGGEGRSNQLGVSRRVAETRTRKTD